MPRPLPVVVVLIALLSGCSEEEPKVIDVGARVTTAADALECPPGAEVQSRTLATGTRAAAPDAQAAVQAWAKRMRRSMDLPLEGYQVAVEEVGTVLFTRDSDGHADIAAIAVRTDAEHGDLGWVVESWARCRPVAASS
jgi:hypothetical protein